MMVARSPRSSPREGEPTRGLHRGERSLARGKLSWTLDKLPEGMVLPPQETCAPSVT